LKFFNCFFLRKEYSRSSQRKLRIHRRAR